MKKVKDQPGLYTAAPGIVQKWKDTIEEDEQYLTDSSGGFALKQKWSSVGVPVTSLFLRLAACAILKFNG